MVRFVVIPTALALARLQIHLVAADGFRGAGRVECKMSDWMPFEACTAFGSKTQTRYIVVQPSRGGSPCLSTAFTTRCSKKECWMGEWSDWVCNNRTGMKQRSRAIASGGIQDPKKCPAKVQRAVCDPIPCVINTLEEDITNPWGECTLKRGKWTKTKALGVKTPAQYGGLCFEPSHPVRKVTVSCAPVNCEVTPMGLDTGAWGECEETSPNVWTKTKTLSIQTPALYGGTPCSDASRLVTASCAQDCQWSTTKYDEWTACDATNVKYHPFKITQEPSYGGAACPSIEQRADSAPCSCWGECLRVDNQWVKSPLFVSPECPAPASCDVEHYCDPLPDAAAKASCAATFQKSGVIQTGRFWIVQDWSKVVQSSWPTVDGCISACATMAGCVAYHYYPEARGGTQFACWQFLEVTTRGTSSGPNTLSAEMIRA